MLFGFVPDVKYKWTGWRFMKKLIIFLMAAVLLMAFSSCAGLDSEEAATGITRSPSAVSDAPDVSGSGLEEEFRAVWVSYNELSMAAVGGGTEQDFRRKAEEIMDYACSLQLNTVIVHASAFSDSFYRSELFPYSKYLTGTQGADPGYDPLKIMVEEAHARSLKIHAWINPYRVSYDTDFSKLSDGNPAKKWHGEGRENEDRIIVCDKGIFYNPASSEAQRLIIDGVREIVKNYEVDGIHYDDYFYPSTDPQIDQISYQAYRSAGGKYSLEDWRRENVNNFVSGLYSPVKSDSPHIEIGISPSANQDYNYHKMYADTALWAGSSGYCDYILPQVYYGFENETLPFEKTVKTWSALCRNSPVKLYFGLAFYKSGKVDEYASASTEEGSAKYEWQRHSDIITRQLQTIRGIPEYRGYALYSYASLKDPENKNAQTELQHYLNSFNKTNQEG